MMGDVYILGHVAFFFTYVAFIFACEAFIFAYVYGCDRRPGMR